MMLAGIVDSPSDLESRLSHRQALKTCDLPYRPG